MSARASLLLPLAFLASLVALAAIALAVMRAPVRIVSGLPDEPEVARARALVENRLAVESGELRVVSSLLGETGAADPALATAAERILAPARARRPGDARLTAALAGLRLAAHRYAHAERLYRQALDREPHYGEARLGLGVALALRAAAEGDPERARGLRLRAISQFAAVPPGDPCAEAALYDRALLLARVGRGAEARSHAREYLALDPASAWATLLRRELDVASP